MADTSDVYLSVYFLTVYRLLYVKVYNKNPGLLLPPSGVGAEKEMLNDSEGFVASSTKKYWHPVCKNK